MFKLFAETATYDFTTTTADSSAAAGSILAIYGIMLPLAIPLLIIPMWKVYKKCGKPGWASIIPVYNTWVLFEITGFPGWWALLSLIPFVNIFPAIVSIVATFRLAKLFGKGAGFGLGLIFLPFIFLPIIGYGKAMPTNATPAAGSGDGGTPNQNPAATPAPFNPVEPVTSAAPVAPQQPQVPDVVPPTNPQPPVVPKAPEAPQPQNNQQPPQSPTPPAV